MQTIAARTVYLPRAHSLTAAFVVYHRDNGPSCSVWMIPGTHSDEPTTRYRSAILANARPVRISKVTHDALKEHAHVR